MAERKKDENTDPSQSPRRANTVWSRKEQLVRVVASENRNTINVRVTGYSAQGGRPYMEDQLCLVYHPLDQDSDDSIYAFAGVFDGHGGAQAAEYTKEKLLTTITKSPGFWSDNDDLILEAIKIGFLNLHNEMSKEQYKWERKPNHQLCTAGTTASVLFIRNGKVYTGHVGDSRIVLGYSLAPSSSSATQFKAKNLTTDHKPESEEEKRRIEKSGGKVLVTRSGISRVVWRRPASDHSGPVRRSTNLIEVPFLAVARSLGDFWSYNEETKMYAVSPEPDVSVMTLDPKVHRCLILGSDGLFDVMSSDEVVNLTNKFDLENKAIQVATTSDNNNNIAIQDQRYTRFNPSARVGQIALARWKKRNPKGDNVSVITIMIDYPTEIDELTNLSENEQDDQEIILVRNESENEEDDEVVSSSHGETERQFLSPTRNSSPTLQSAVVSSSSNQDPPGRVQAIESPSIGDIVKLRKRRTTTPYCSTPPERRTPVSRKSSSNGRRMESEFQRPPKIMKMSEADAKTFSVQNERDANVKSNFRSSARRSSIRILETPTQLQSNGATKIERRASYFTRFRGTCSDSSQVITPILPPGSPLTQPMRLTKKKLSSGKEDADQSKSKRVQKRKSSEGGRKSRLSLMSEPSVRKRRHTIAAKTTTKEVSPVAERMMTRSKSRLSNLRTP